LLEGIGERGGRGDGDLATRRSGRGRDGRDFRRPRTRRHVRARLGARRREEKEERYRETKDHEPYLQEKRRGSRAARVVARDDVARSRRVLAPQRGLDLFEPADRSLDRAQTHLPKDPGEAALRKIARLALETCQQIQRGGKLATEEIGDQ